MRVLKWLPYAGALTVALVVAATASGGSPGTYHGTFSGSVAYNGCEGAAPPAALASGTWNVNLRDEKSGVLTVSIFTNGRHHVSFGSLVEPVAADGEETFALRMDTLAGELTVRLDETAFTYTIDGYDYFGIECESVVYSGSLSRG